MPPLGLSPNWGPRVALRDALTELYRQSFFHDGNPCMPPNTADARSGGKRAAFVLRDHITDIDRDDFDAAGEFGRGSIGKVARYMRLYMIGSGVFATRRVDNPARQCMAPSLATAVAALRDVLTVYHWPHTDPSGRLEDAIIYGAASILAADFAAARAAAVSDPLVRRSGSVVLQSRALLLARRSGIMMHAAVAALAVLVTVAAGVWLVTKSPKTLILTKLPPAVTTLFTETVGSGNFMGS